MTDNLYRVNAIIKWRGKPRQVRAVVQAETSIHARSLMARRFDISVEIISMRVSRTYDRVWVTDNRPLRTMAEANELASRMYEEDAA